MATIDPKNENILAGTSQCVITKEGKIIEGFIEYTDNFHLAFQLYDFTHPSQNSIQK